MYKIAALLSLQSDCRFVSLIAEGLIDHPEVDVAFSTPIVQYHKVLAKGVDSTAFMDTMLEADYIVRPMAGSESKRLPQDLKDFFESRDLWYKTIALDLMDEAYQIDKDTLDAAFLYVKRSCDTLVDDRIFPSNLGVLSCYVPEQCGRDIDVATFYDIDRLKMHGDGYIGRRNLYSVLQEFDWSGYNTVFDCKYNHRPSYATVGDAVCTDDPLGTPYEKSWKYFHNQQARTKIILTCWPSSHDSDNRTWEALASGALCFIDICTHPVWDLVDGEHYIEYDAHDLDSIRKATEIAQELLADDETRIRIAEAGQKFVFENHMGINRIEAILQEVRRRETRC